jgi:hypothetical protein
MDVHGSQFYRLWYRRASSIAIRSTVSRRILFWPPAIAVDPDPALLSDNVNLPLDCPPRATG